MKNYKEMANDVLRRIGEYETEQRKRRKFIKRVVTPICCFCLVVLVGIGLWQGNFFKSTPPVELGDPTHIEKNNLDDGKDGTAMGTDGTSGQWYGPGQEAPPSDSNNFASSEDNRTTDDICKQIFYVNEIKNTVSGALKYLDPADHYTEIWSADKTAQYLGVYLNNIGNNRLKYQGDGNQRVTYNNNGELVRDIMSFEYLFKDTTVIVSVSKISTPYDCIYLLDDEEISTYVNNIPVVFAGTVGTMAEQPINEDFLVADFEYNGINYRVEAENISHYDFYKIVLSVITR